MIARRGLPLALALGSLLGCTTPCEALQQRAQACGFSQPRYVDARDSVCQATRRELGPETFDAYASCVDAAPCDDHEAVAGCLEDWFPNQSSSPCARYTLWAVSCGLEPAGTEDDCQSISETPGAAGFESWVDCITADGCPTPGDDRYNRCQSILPPEVQTLVTACELVTEWTARCEGPGGGIEVAAVSFPECLIQAQPFTAQSYLDFATCQSTLDCDDIPGRLDCVLALRITDRSQIHAQCEELIAFSNTCGSGLGSSSVSACEALFARFTPESFQSYIDCLKTLPCDDPSAVPLCAPLLQIQ